MKSFAKIVIVAYIIALLSWTIGNFNWLQKDGKFYTLNYTAEDTSSINEYQQLILAGLKDVETFFGDHFKSKFEVFIYPHRKFLDSAWSNDWKIPGFKSECWMVASGVAKRIDILSPKTWDTEACEHTFSDKEHTRRVITHELVHVFHGQLNVSPDFSDVKNIDWFVEGLATYASGQCDSGRIAEVIKGINGGTIPQSTNQFWTGKIKYGLSGSLVMYLDKKYGRAKLKELLKYGDDEKLLQALGTSEKNLLSEWKQYMLSFPTR